MKHSPTRRPRHHHYHQKHRHHRDRQLNSRQQNNLSLTKEIYRQPKRRPQVVVKRVHIKDPQFACLQSAQRGLQRRWKLVSKRLKKDGKKKSLSENVHFQNSQLHQKTHQFTPNKLPNCVIFSLTALLFLVSLFATLKLSFCLLNSTNCSLELPVQEHFNLPLLLLTLILDALLLYRIMLSLSTFWEKLTFNQSKQQHPPQQTLSHKLGTRNSITTNSSTSSSHHNNNSTTAEEVRLSMASIALVSQYFTVVKAPSEGKTPESTIPSIHLDLVDEDDNDDGDYGGYEGHRSGKILGLKKRLSLSSIELGSEFLQKYAATEDWLRLQSLATSAASTSANFSSSSESVNTETSDYYLEMPRAKESRKPRTESGTSGYDSEV